MSLQEKITFYEIKSGVIQCNKRSNQHQLLQTKGLIFENNNTCDRMKVTCTYIEAHIIIYEFVHQVPNEIFTMSRFYLLQFYKMSYIKSS